MRSSMPTLDDQFPTLRGDESPKEMFSKIVNYLFVMREALDYTLANLSIDNWNAESWDETQQPLNQLAAELSSLASKVTQQGISVNDLYREMGSTKDRVTGLEERMDTAEGDVAYLAELCVELTQRLGTVEEMVRAEEDTGAITIGKEGTLLNLVGQVSINGTPYEEETV